MHDDVKEIPASTPNFRTELAEKLAELVPEAVADGKIDTRKLEELLDGDAADTRERFGLFWPGKKRALRAAQEPTTATLVPDKENSKDWDETQNVFIEGDNLEVLKILQKHYHGKIKMIYIDPPYNTGKDFVYPDNYREGLKSYLEFTHQVDDEGKKLSTNSDQAGRYHSNWLNMMYPRLKLARNLLTDDGAIFISIDDHEIDNLRKLCNEIFGENNFVAALIWEKGRKNDAKLVSVGHEYILVYAKSRSWLAEAGITWREAKPGAMEIQNEYLRLRSIHGDDDESVQMDLRRFYKALPRDHPSKKLSRYRNVDKNGVWRDDNMSWPGGGGPTYEVLHPVTGQPCKIPDGGWRFSTQEKMQEMIDSGRVMFREDETEPPIRKTYLVRIDNEDVAPQQDSNEAGSQVAGSYFYRSALQASNLMMDMFGKKVFDNPKDLDVLSRWVKYVTQPAEKAIILDFFAGSGTTAHAVMKANVEDEGNRCYIQVQLPEPVDTSTSAGKNAAELGYNTISELAQARIKKALCEIKEAGVSSIDGGFRTYRLADTNFAKWQLTSDAAETELEQHLLSLRESADDQAPQDALLTELLLKRGYSLTEHIDELDIAGLEIRGVRDVDGDYGLLAYLNEHQKPTLEQLRELVDAAEAQIIVLEDAFQGDDQLKTNLAQLCKTKGVELWTA